MLDDGIYVLAYFHKDSITSYQKFCDKKERIEKDWDKKKKIEKDVIKKIVKKRHVSTKMVFLVVM